MQLIAMPSNIISTAVIILCWFKFPCLALVAPHRNPKVISTSGSLAQDQLFKYFNQRNVDRSVSEVIVAAAEMSHRTWTAAATPFFGPYDCHVAVEAFKSVPGIKASLIGGYRLAERQRIVFSRAMEDVPDILEEAIDAKGFVGALSIDGNFLFEKPSYEDIVSSLCSNGIDRSQIGDIPVLNDRGAQVLVDLEAAALYKSTLTKIRNCDVVTRVITLDQLALRPYVEKVVTSIEASMRLDAVASAGLSLSRTKMVKYVESNDVYVNFNIVSNAAMQLQEGAIVSVRGVGRIEIQEVEKTNKGKFKVKMHRVS